MRDKLTITLSSSDLEKVNANKKPEDELPKIYRKDSASSIPISRDMEAFLILEDISFKDTMSDCVKAALDVSEDELEKTLFKEAVSKELEEVNEVIAECSSKLGTTESVRKDINESEFVNVTEISEILSDVTSSNSWITLQSRLFKFKGIYLSQLTTRFTPGEASNSEQIKQTKSWLTPLTAY